MNMRILEKDDIFTIKVALLFKLFDLMCRDDLKCERFFPKMEKVYFVRSCAKNDLHPLLKVKFLRELARNVQN